MISSLYLFFAFEMKVPTMFVKFCVMILESVIIMTENFWIFALLALALSKLKYLCAAETKRDM